MINEPTNRSTPVETSARSEFLDLVVEALNLRASDLHIDPLRDGYQIRLRIDGVLTVLRSETRTQGEKIINQFRAAAGIEPGTVFTPKGVREFFEIDGRRVDCRMTLVPCVSGPKLAIRILDPRKILHSVAALGLHGEGLSNIHRWLNELNGMFLVSGPTGSGKTTTLYALLHELAEAHRHIVTIEDPAEYEIDGINQIQVDLRHQVGFAEGVRTILRLDPDQFMIGELRDPDSAKAGVSAAVGGHVVLTSLHARDAVSSITSLRNFGALDHQIAAALGVVVNQRLVRKLCTQCRERTELTNVQREWFKSQGVESPVKAWRSRGCEDCAGNGYFGRTGLFEVWHLDETDYEMILAAADEETIRDKLERQGHEAIWKQAVAAIEDGVAGFDEVQRLGLALPWQ